MAENPSQPSSKRQELTVTPEESGMKLLRFLERRLGGAVPKSMLYKWIRTGQVRVNKGRSDPHRPLDQGDAIRVPPFADARRFPDRQVEADYALPFPALDALGPDVPVLAHTQGVLVLAKPEGLAVHPGTSVADSLTERLAAAFAGQPFVPAPAHRLDRQTSGLILVGTSHKSQAALHECFASGAIQKHYLAWAAGHWPHAGATLLADEAFCFQDAGGRQSLQRMPKGQQIALGQTETTDETGGQDKTAPAKAHVLAEILNEAHQSNGPGLALAMPVRTLQAPEMPKMPGASKGATLLLIRLITGKKHQIRIQTAARKHPIVGDSRYGGPHFPHMLLHAFSVRLPATMGGALFSVSPNWPAPFQTDPAALAAASEVIEQALSQQ